MKLTEEQYKRFMLVLRIMRSAHAQGVPMAIHDADLTIMGEVEALINPHAK